MSPAATTIILRPKKMGSGTAEFHNAEANHEICQMLSDRFQSLDTVPLLQAGHCVA
jgi:hypothetical protein